ncbi:MAG TPA: MBL fold metallo-hydrolase [Cyclobacteriaceae bacterium]|nr:MBL fold metallo-hydrolase [Cyclobacteriaceae bacterium]
MIQIQTFAFNPFSENTYVVFDQTGEGVIIDPGCYETEEKTTLAKFIEDEGIKIKYLLNTHCHIDHVLGNDFVKEKYKVPFLIHPKEEPVLKSVKAYAPSYGFAQYHEALPDQFINEGDKVLFGNIVFQVVFLPGHAPGHIGFYDSDSKSLFSGDVLFQQSIGRTDLPGGDHNTLIKSIHQKIFTLPDDVVVYPGHGDTTTVGEEKVSNPFCALSLLK